MTDAELAEAKRYGRLDLACALADKAIDVAYLAVAAFLLARPLDAWLQTHRLLAGNWSLRLAVLLLLIMAIHIAAVVPAVVLLRSRAGASVQAEHADFRPLALAVS